MAYIKSSAIYNKDLLVFLTRTLYINEILANQVNSDNQILEILKHWTPATIPVTSIIEVIFTLLPKLSVGKTILKVTDSSRPYLLLWSETYFASLSI